MLGRLQHLKGSEPDSHIWSIEEWLTLSLLLQCNGSLLVELECFFLVVVFGVVAAQLFAPVPE